MADSLFPHLSDTSFPNIDNMNVYKYENNFDYDKWKPGVKIHLCTVLWNSDYKDVVKFGTDSYRDKYFDNLTNRVIELTTDFHEPPTNNIKVPIPYGVASKYNYLWIEIPIMTSDDDKINYEETDRYKRYYYFIDSVTQGAPSTSILNIVIDNWTTFINNIDISYLVLERGHAPMSMIDVNTYLSDPINHNRYLLAPDVDFANNIDIVRKSDFIPVNNGEKYIMIACTMSMQQVKSFVVPSALSGIDTAATYSDFDARWGYQFGVSDYQWGLGGYDLSNNQTQTTSFQSTDNIVPNNNFVFAVKATDANALFSTIAEKASFVFKSFSACYMVDDSMFDIGDSFTFFGVRIYQANQVRDSLLYDLTLSTSDFKFEDKYKNVTKLYTFPYSRIEVTDNNGNVKSFRIENTSDVKLKKDVSLAFPYLSIQTYLVGINGSGSATYKWEKLNNQYDTRNNYSDDFSSYLWDWSIPTYALYVSGYDMYKSTNYANQEKSRYDAIAEYQRNVKSLNTSYVNALASADTARDNAYRSADTGYDNAIRTATAGQNNANASGNTAQTNADNNADLIVNNNTLNVACNNSLADIHDNQLYNTVSANNSNNSLMNTYDNNATASIASTEITTSSIAGVTNAVASAVSSGTSAFASGTMAGGVAMGAVSAGLAILPNAIASGVSTWASITNSVTIAQTTIGTNNLKTTANNNTNASVRDYAITTTNESADRHNTMITGVTNNDSATLKTNAANTNATVHANASRSYSASADNASETKATTKSNADASHDMMYSNSLYSRNAGVQNQQSMMEQKRVDNRQSYNAHKMDAPESFGSNSGDMTLDAMERRGLQIKIRTERDSDIAQAGDLMLRFGYYLNQAWDVKNTGLNLMKYYTYWKVTDIWINQGEGVNQRALIDIQNAFFRGVTVWSNPDKIGKVTIYDNE